MDGEEREWRERLPGSIVGEETTEAGADEEVGEVGTVGTTSLVTVVVVVVLLPPGAVVVVVVVVVFL